MPPQPSPTLTDREAEIMEQLWTLGTATAEEIRHRLSDEPHDSTVRTMLRILETKGFVSHKRSGRSYVYKPLIKREKVQGKTLTDVIRQFFSGSPHELVLRLLEEEQLSVDELDDLMNQFQQGRKK
ncbi:BlaI/MecI/CopY family transcriptional regulator [Schlesneria sp. T3-172]|uniref:BlaI/MecI/CopY family transcriptional regulator n=1 Tax=Schlesneria sphaerica TaxID=3373610 RepID=UPI0037C56BC2